MTCRTSSGSSETRRCCGIALGSNIGDRLAYLEAARIAVAQLHHGSGQPLFSPVYETEPVGCEPGTAPYLNAVMEIETADPPEMLLAALHRIEAAMGRPASHGFNAPRTLDLDLLYAGDLVLNTPQLILPHPRLATRRFVLQPLADLRPELILPGARRSVAQLLAALPPTPAVKRWAQP